jgi:hypothetical protein
VIAVALLLAAQAVPTPAGDARVEQAALLHSFRSICLPPAAKLGDFAPPSTMANFSPTAVMPTGFEWVEVSAWQHGGIRLFRMTDPRETNPRSMCGVSAILTRLDSDRGLVEAVEGLAETHGGEGDGSPGIAVWTLALRGGAIRVEVDRISAPNICVRLIAWAMKT